jgi:hypothetical protein
MLGADRLPVPPSAASLAAAELRSDGAAVVGAVFALIGVLAEALSSGPTELDGGAFSGSIELPTSGSRQAVTIHDAHKVHVKRRSMLMPWSLA